MKILTSSFLTIVLALIIFAKPSQQTALATIWEYKFENSANEKKANELGTQGWELIAIQSPAGVLGAGITPPVYVYKRLEAVQKADS